MNKKPITDVDEPDECVYIECQIEKWPNVVAVSAPTIPPMQLAYAFLIDPFEV